MDALSQAILRLLRRQDETDRRLAEIEKALGIAPVVAPPPVTQPAPPPPAVAPPVAPRDLPPPVSTIPPPRPESPQLETRLGLAWVNRIGAITLTLCAAFIFKYAVDNAWIGPGGRVALGVFAGLAA